MRITDFVCWIAVISLVSAFVLSLMVKWGVLEWLQLHAPNDFIHKLLTCKFCCSWWVSVINSVILVLVTGNVELLYVPFCATLLIRDRW